MRIQFIKFLLAAGFVSFLATTADAQRTGRRRNQPTTTDTTSQQQTNINRPSGYNYGNIPIERDTSRAGGYNDSLKFPSLRNPNAFDKSGIMDRTPLPYEHLRWDDALYAEKVWREIDLREKMNQTFRFVDKDDNGNDQMFINILLRAIRRDSIMAFSDDRFSQPLKPEDIASITAGGAPDTVDVTDINDPSKVVKRVVTQRAFDPAAIVKIRLKEEWVFDREASRMFVRILGICPLKNSYLPNGQVRGVEPMFWVYYPDLRPLLARYEVYNPKNMGMGRMTWEELFESRMFSSYITKSTLDNPMNQVIRQYIKDPILALLEGDNIKERMFNYEQDLWSY